MILFNQVSPGVVSNSYLLFGPYNQVPPDVVSKSYLLFWPFNQGPSGVVCKSHRRFWPFNQGPSGVVCKSHWPFGPFSQGPSGVVNQWSTGPKSHCFSSYIMYIPQIKILIFRQSDCQIVESDQFCILVCSKTEPDMWEFHVHYILMKHFNVQQNDNNGGTPD